ncbi:MAG: ATP-dependent helicase/nuclease subunit A [Verrucomicrobiales bacterium]|jgi:ATP-dependent helicase/nuclease subunit A
MSEEEFQDDLFSAPLSSTPSQPVSAAPPRPAQVRVAAIPNEMILASAGSGKTWRLTNRFIKLLTRGFSPERLIALTFTRKAAAEFLDEILRKLSHAAENEDVALGLQRDLGEPEFDSKFARKLLREVVDKLHVLMLGTLDSFFHRILRCFPTEFGLTAGFDLLEEHEAQVARRDVFTKLFEEGGVSGDFVEAFRLATFGSEEKQLTSKLDWFTRQYHGLYLEMPEALRWGGERLIWPDGCPWLRGIGDLELECRSLEGAIKIMNLPTRVAKMWDDFIEFMRRMAIGKRWGKLRSLPDKLIENYGVLRRGGPVVISQYGKDYEFGPEVCAHCRRLIEYLMFCEVFPHVQRTRGVFQVLAAFESRYHDQVRRAGRLGFDDVQQLLAGGKAGELSQTGDANRLNIDYRLDGQFDHWLLDEFQDTSLPQWKVIENLIDEVVQDDSGERSFFYVGDVKQAIFGWRGGDSRLFHDIFDHYDVGSEPRIRETRMEVSFRSGPAILDAVNRVFGNRFLFDRMFPDHSDFVARWFKNWGEHEPNDKKRGDFFQLLNVPKAERDGPTGEEMRFEVVTQLLEQFRPHEKKMTCGILVRRNTTATKLADYIRSKTQIPVVIEGDTLIGSDHPVAASFLALLQLAAHPGDRLAWKHLTMTPAKVRSRGWLVETTLERIHDQGFTAAFEFWLELLIEGRFEPDEFAKRRVEQLRQATREFDETGSRKIDEFMRYAKAFTARESPASGAVQIMTIHKSKGLGFDAVIVAEIEGLRDDPLTDLGFLSLVANRNGEGRRREIEWVLSMPHQQAGKLDPVLRRARAKLENEAAFEELCVLYVALTRAKFANFVVCGEPNEAVASARALVTGALASRVVKPESEDENSTASVVCEIGDSDWHLADQFRSDREAVVFQPTPPPVEARRRFTALRRQLPSELADQASSPKGAARLLFTPASSVTAAYGTLVHELFEEINWLDDFEPNELEARLNDLIDLDDPQQLQARDEVLRSLAIPEIERVFRKSHFAGHPEAWLERRFELINEGAWISGTFDRVVVNHSGAWVYDFKTNRVKTPEEIQAACDVYKIQLATYRTALSRLLGFETSRIHSYLIFTRPGRLREVR